MVTTGGSLQNGINRNISARIPHQSKFGSEVPNFASFPPGEAIAPSALQTTIYRAVPRHV
jgi:hypothetical protein